MLVLLWKFNIPLQTLYMLVLLWIFNISLQTLYMLVLLWKFNISLQALYVFNVILKKLSKNLPELLNFTTFYPIQEIYLVIKVRVRTSASRQDLTIHCFCSDCALNTKNSHSRTKVGYATG